MDIKAIEVRGIRDLYAYYASIYSKPTSQIYSDGKRKQTLLDNVGISFELGDISDIEYFALQNYSSGNCIHGTYEMRPKKDPELTRTEFENQLDTWIDKMEALQKQMKSDPGIIDAAAEILESPVQYSSTVIVRFTGIKFLTLVHATNVFEMFKDWMGDLISVPKEVGLENYQFPPVEEVFDDPLGVRKPALSFGDYVTQKFLTGFYSFYNEFLTTVDLVSDSYVHTRCLENLHSGEVRLLELQSPLVSIDMRGDEEFAKKLQIIKAILSPNSNYVNEGVRESDILKIRVSTKQSLKTFLHIVKTYPFDFIKNWEDLKIVLERTETITLPDLNHYTIRINNLYNMSYLLQQEKRNENRLASLEYIPYGTPISFTLEATITDWERYIAEIEQVLCTDNEGNQYYKRELERAGELAKNHLVDYELWNLFHGVAQYIKAVSTALK